MAVVLGGLGQPEESPLVTGGLGQAGTAPPGAMRATLAGSGTVSGVLTADGAPTPPAAGGGRFVLAGLPRPRPPAIPAYLAATLAGSSSVTADPTYRIDPDALVAELATALLLDLV